MNPLFYLVPAALILIWNIVTFALYAIDKSRAKKGEWRIRESTLLLSAFCMGGVGALLGMQILRHKTQHIQFKILVPLAVVVNVVIVVAYAYFLGTLEV